MKKIFVIILVIMMAVCSLGGTNDTPFLNVTYNTNNKSLNVTNFSNSDISISNLVVKKLSVDTTNSINLFQVGDDYGGNHPKFKVDTNGNMEAYRNISTRLGYGQFMNVQVGAIGNSTIVGAQGEGGLINYQNSITEAFTFQSRTGSLANSTFVLNARVSTTNAVTNLFILQNNGVDKFSISTNGNVTASGRLYALATNPSVANIFQVGNDIVAGYPPFTVSSNGTITGYGNFISRSGFANFGNTRVGSPTASSVSGATGSGGVINLQNISTDAFSFTSLRGTSNSTVFLFNARPTNTVGVVTNLMVMQVDGVEKFSISTNGDVTAKGRIYTSSIISSISDADSIWMNNSAWRFDSTYIRCELGTTSMQLKYGNGTHLRPVYEARSVNGTGFNPGIPTDPTTAFIDAGGFPVVSVLSNGWVGINNTNPAVALSVVGSAIALNGTNYTVQVFTNVDGAVYQFLGFKLP